ncbi:MAG: FAD-binding oxidoreductase [Acidobacteriaceae bacterium]|nr:FAD-binding oxidoreductase [Acidobacteriaceae bacterium]
MQPTRRDIIRYSALTFAAARTRIKADERTEVNDVHSQLNRTCVTRVVRPQSLEQLREAILQARRDGLCVSVSGSSHSMGGQQFGTGMVLLDMRGLNRVNAFDGASRTIEAEAGIEWPELLSELNRLQAGSPSQLGIFQKQTGADRLSLGGALASNVHGRGLNLKPFINDVESFQLMNAEGDLLCCDRSTHPDLFRLVIGGYGLFGVVTSVRLRLTPRVKVRRVVRIADTQEIPDAFAGRIRDGYLYGDFQFATDSGRDSFLRRGVFSCYQPVDPDTPLTQNPTRFHPEDWARLTYYSHTHKRLAFNLYTKRYLATSGQIYYHDWQLSAAYQPGYHLELDRKMGAAVKATEMITEIYVPRSALVSFMEEARRVLREGRANLIYGTVRLIEKDEESFLRWARQSYACVIFNLHVTHDAGGLDAAARAFRALIDLGIERDGSFYLTYHRWATRRQVEICYPQFRDFLAQKLVYDGGEVFQSDWYVHHKMMLA